MIDAVESLPVPVTPEALPPAITTAQTVENLLHLWVAELRESSRVTYHNCLIDFAGFVKADSIIEAVTRLLSHGKQGARTLLLGYRVDLHERRALAPNSTNLRLTAVRSLINFAEDFGTINWRVTVKAIPTKVLRDTSGPPVEGIRQMLEQAGQKGDDKSLRNQAIIRLFFDCGLRRKELVNLDLDDLDMTTGRLLILGKGRSEKEAITLPAPTRHALQKWLDVRGNAPGPLFTSTLGGRRLGAGSVYQVIRAVGKRAGFSTSPHRLRHSSVTTACEVESDLGRVQRFSRHASVDMVGRYRDNMEDAAGQVAEKVAAEV